MFHKGESVNVYFNAERRPVHGIVISINDTGMIVDTHRGSVFVQRKHITTRDACYNTGIYRVEKLSTR